MTQVTIEEDIEQREQLARVADRLSGAVLDFLRQRVGETFHADELRRAVGKAAPGSADRVLRDLRQRKLVSYEVVSRRRSEYRCLGVAS